MQVGDKVRISGTSLTGEIISIDNRYEPKKHTKTAFYTIKLSDGTTNEYVRNELRNCI